HPGRGRQYGVRSPLGAGPDERGSAGCAELGVMGMAFAIMQLTDAAAERIREIIEDSDKPVTGVRVGVRNAGCAGMAYTLDYVAEPVQGDDHIQDKGVNVWVEPKATLFLLGTVMDFEETKMSSGFTFN